MYITDLCICVHVQYVCVRIINDCLDKKQALAVASKAQELSSSVRTQPVSTLS